MRMINLSLDELRLIAQTRNTSDFENKSKEDLIKTLNEPTKTRNKTRNKTRSKTKTNTKIRTRTKTRN